MRRLTRPTATACLLGLALALPAPARASDPGEVRAAARAALLEHLSEREVDRLMRRQGVLAAIDDLLEHYDGQDDTIGVEITPEGMRLVVVLRDRTTFCVTPLPTSEVPDPQEQCHPQTTVKHRGSIDLDQQWWAKPKPRPRPRPTPEQDPPPDPLADADPARPPSVLWLDPDPQLEADRAIAGQDPALVAMIRASMELRERVQRGGFKDPFAANGIPEYETMAKPIIRGKLLRPPDNVVHRALQNLRQPFSEMRMRLADPYPDLLADNPMAPPVTLPEPDKGCVKSWKAEAFDVHPPTLACIRTYVRHQKLENNTAYQIAKQLSVFIGHPILATIMAEGVREASSEMVTGQMWTLLWLEWTRLHPGDQALATALDRLTPEERATLRPRVRRWWKKGRYADLISNLYERHMARLYPGLVDKEGVPVRKLFTDDLLWATNWLSVNEDVEATLVKARFKSLGEQDRRVLSLLVGHAAAKRHFPNAIEVVAALTPSSR